MLSKLTPIRVYLGVGIVSAITSHQDLVSVNYGMGINEALRTNIDFPRLIISSDWVVAQDSVTSARFNVKKTVVMSHLTSAIIDTLLWPISNVFTKYKWGVPPTMESNERLDSIECYRQATNKQYQLLSYSEYLEALCYNEMKRSVFGTTLCSESVGRSAPN